MSQKDLLAAGLGSREETTSGATNLSAPSQDLTNQASTGEAADAARRGTNIIDQLGEAQSANAEGASKSPDSARSTPSDSELKSSVSDGSKSDETSSLDSKSKPWTEDSMMKEMKKLREENKAQRLKYQEAIEKISSETQDRLAEKEQKYEELFKAQEELQTLKEKEADKKRDMAEKLAHREGLIADLKARLELSQKEHESQLSQFRTELETFKAEAQAQEQVYKTRLDEELQTIPEKYKETADLMIRGAGTVREGLLAIQEAKLKGLFEDKTSVVVHNVPGAKDGARVTNDELKAKESERRKNMDPGSKIREALGNINSNPMYRSR